MIDFFPSTEEKEYLVWSIDRHGFIYCVCSSMVESDVANV